jgi:hypothetical protein
MELWFCDYSQYDNLFNFWVNIYIFEFLLIYFNDLKLGIQKYHVFLQLIIINNDSISNEDDVACHASTRCYKV